MLIPEMFAGSLLREGGVVASRLLPAADRERYAREARRQRYAHGDALAPDAPPPTKKAGKKSAEKAGERWVTINGGSGKDGDGGTRIRIDGKGNITAGPKALRDAGITKLKHFGGKGKKKAGKKGGGKKKANKAAKKPGATKPSKPEGVSNAELVQAATAAAARQETAVGDKALGALTKPADKPKKNPSDNLIPFLPLDRDPPEEPAAAPAAAPREQPATDLSHWRAALAKLEPAQRKSLLQRFTDWWAGLMKAPDTTEYEPGFLGALQRVAAKTFHSKDAAERERYQKDSRVPAEVMHYAERWITLNGDSGEDGNGGTPVKVDDDGKIVAGPDGLAEKGVKHLDDFGGKGQGKKKKPAAKPAGNFSERKIGGGWHIQKENEELPRAEIKKSKSGQYEV